MQRGVHVPANARVLGNKQVDSIQNILGSVGLNMNAAAPNGAFYLAAGSSGSQTGTTGSQSVMFDASRVVRTSTETRGPNTAMCPVINI